MLSCAAWSETSLISKELANNLVSARRSFNDEVAEGKVERRGFKSSLLTTARGFGKRSLPARVVAEERWVWTIL